MLKQRNSALARRKYPCDARRRTVLLGVVGAVGRRRRAARMKKGRFPDPRSENALNSGILMQFRCFNNVNRFRNPENTLSPHSANAPTSNYVVFTTEFPEDVENRTAVRVFSPQRFSIPLEKQRKSKPKNGKTPLFRCFPASFPHKG